MCNDYTLPRGWQLSGLPRSGEAEGLGNALLVIGPALDLPALADQALPERTVVVVDRHYGVGLPNQRMQP